MVFLIFDGCLFPFLHLPASHFNADLDDSDTVDETVKCGTKDGNYMCQILTSIGEHLGASRSQTKPDRQIALFQSKCTGLYCLQDSYRYNCGKFGAFPFINRAVIANK